MVKTTGKGKAKKGKKGKKGGTEKKVKDKDSKWSGKIYESKKEDD